MAKDYVIGIGGTGARCVEALTYLAAAGVFQNDLHILIVDSDRSNGNSDTAKQLVESYQALQAMTQPPRPERKRMLGFSSEKLPPPALFRASINQGSDGRRLQIDWHSPNDSSVTFRRLINYQTLPDPLKKHLELFYTQADLDMTMEEGYRGRTNVGSVALKQDLESTAALEGNSLRRFLEELNRDLNTGPARLFVIGSVFGGTGAAGLPTIPALINNLGDDSVLAPGNRKKLIFGSAMMGPYFAFPPPDDAQEKHPGTDSTQHAVATQAALLHYAHVPPDYDRSYLHGAPQRPQTNEQNVGGGTQQKNKPHYAEIMAALSAWDFFTRPDARSDERLLHYADTYKGGEDEGARWANLPLSLTLLPQRKLLTRRLVVFTTFAYFYHRLLHQRFIENREYQDMLFYGHNFNRLSLDQEIGQLSALNDFLDGYINWLRQIGETGAEGGGLPFFLWQAFSAYDRSLSGGHLGNLMTFEGPPPRHATDGFDEIRRRLEHLTLTKPETNSATGLFIYLLWQAVSEFCTENYDWK